MSNSTDTRDLVGLIAFLRLCVAVFGVGGAATTTSVGSGCKTLVTAL